MQTIPHDQQIRRVKTPRDRAIDSSRLARERLLQAMRVLETALAKAAPHRESAWRTRVVTALVALEEAMQQQATELKGEAGLLADLLREAPRLDCCRIRQLRRQYDDLVRQIGSLREEFSPIGAAAARKTWPMPARKSKKRWLSFRKNNRSWSIVRPPQ